MIFADMGKLQKNKGPGKNQARRIDSSKVVINPTFKNFNKYNQ
jgi:hypothetical protein